MPQLIAPTPELESAWRAAHAEWGPGLHEDGFGLRPDDDVDTPAGFSAWLRRLVGDGTCSYRWIVEDGTVLDGGTLAADDGSRSHIRLHDAGNAPARDRSRTPGCGGNTPAMHDGGTAPNPAGSPGLRRYLISTAQHTP